MLIVVQSSMNDKNPSLFLPPSFDASREKGGTADLQRIGRQRIAKLRESNGFFSLSRDTRSPDACHAVQRCGGICGAVSFVPFVRLVSFCQQLF